MKMKLLWIFLEEFELKNIKKARSAISFASHCALKEKYEMVPWKELLQVCPREDRAGVTHAISPISFKLSQFMRLIKLFKNTECFGLWVHSWGIRALTTNPWGKRLKFSSKNALPTSLSHTNRMRWTLIN